MRLKLTLAALAVMLLAPPSVASAAPLDGATAVREVEVLRPTGPGERGSVVVWTRVHHAGLTAAARRNAVAGAAHLGRVRVCIPRVGCRTATRELHDAAAERGYTVRFRSRRGKARAAAAAVDVQVTATQTVDLDGDGDTEDSSTDTSRVDDMTPTAVPQAILPPNGTYGLGGFPQANGFDVRGGEIVVFWVSSDVGCVNDVTPSAPVNPATGAFSFDHKGVKASGAFASDGQSAALQGASWDGVMGAGGPKCKGSLPAGSTYSLVQRLP